MSLGNNKNNTTLLIYKYFFVLPIQKKWVKITTNYLYLLYYSTFSWLYFFASQDKKGRFEVCIPEFCRIYNDVNAFTAATRIGKSTVYRWLHGTPPSISHINLIQNFLDIQLTADYVIEFNRISKQAADINEPGLLQEIINESN
jgi:hypothetical protein